MYLHVKIRVIATLWMFLQVPTIPSLGEIINPNFEIFASMTLITDIIVHKDDKKKVIIIRSQQEILMIPTLCEHRKGTMLQDEVQHRQYLTI